MSSFAGQLAAMMRNLCYMFADKAKVRVKAGDGGDGIVSFRRERYIDKGGPDGGDGGDGGNIIFRASHNQNTLAKLRYQKLLKAENGKSGGKSRKTGKNGTDLIVDVPVGTVLVDSDNKQIFDLTQDGQTVIAAKGGKGGYGNAHFTSSTRQAPKVAEKGESGEETELNLELKMIAEVGLIGMPNAGKSTLLSTISNANPEIADYPFTTLKPNLGVVDVGKDDSLLFADIPGLIEGASQGKGLGDDFLRHVERTKVLLHLIDAYNDDPVQAYNTIRKELKAYSNDLAKRPQLVVLNKIDGLDSVLIDGKAKQLEKVRGLKGKVYKISAKSGQGVDKLLYKTAELVKAARDKTKTEDKSSELPVLTISDEKAWKIAKEKDIYIISGKKIERFAERTDFNNTHGQNRIFDIMKKMGILHELRRKGINEGDKIRILGKELEY